MTDLVHSGLTASIPSENEAGGAIRTLEPMRGLSGHDAYCHVCWEPVYSCWAAKEAPDAMRCAFGPYTAQTCPHAVATARQQAAIQRLKDSGLWVGSLGASLAHEAKSRQAGPA